eukprot:200766-Rhodomonas_salina.1
MSSRCALVTALCSCMQIGHGETCVRISTTQRRAYDISQVIRSHTEVMVPDPAGGYVEAISTRISTRAATSFPTTNSAIPPLFAQSLLFSTSSAFSSSSPLKKRSVGKRASSQGESEDQKKEDRGKKGTRRGSRSVPMSSY